MKIFATLTSVLLLVASNAQANFGDIDASIEEIKASVVYVAQPEHVVDRIIAFDDTCHLPLTHLVSLPANFEPAGEVRTACVAE